MDHHAHQPRARQVCARGASKARPHGGRSTRLRLSLAAAQKLVLCESIPPERRLRYLLGLTTGPRDGELAGLRVGDVRLAAGLPVLSVERALQLIGPEGHATVGRLKTEESRREAPIHPAAARRCVGGSPRASSGTWGARHLPARRSYPIHAGGLGDHAQQSSCATIFCALNSPPTSTVSRWASMISEGRSPRCSRALRSHRTRAASSGARTAEHGRAPLHGAGQRATRVLRG
jgi:hypothetical protein